MEITLKFMRISGFKGINDLTLDLNNQSAIISGSNGTGKTTVYDAFLWCLTGKDSAGYQSDVKPVDANGQRVLGRDSDVVAILRIADATGAATDVTLHRQLHEVWSKPRDAADKVYSRDETLCWINDVPKKIDREYTPEVINLFGGNEQTFRLLTSYTAFMAMNYMARRQALLDMTGDITVPGFDDIEAILKGATPDEAKKRLSEQMKRNNDTLSTIPSRIDELQRTLAQVPEDEFKSATRAISEITSDINTIDNQLTGKSDAAQKMNALLARKRELSAEQSKIAAAVDSERQTALNNARISVSRLETTIASINTRVENNQLHLSRLSVMLTESEASRQKLLDAYYATDAEKYKAPDDITRCEKCGQELPADQLENALEKHVAQWKKDHSDKLVATLLKGKAAGAERDKLANEVARYTHENEDYQAQIVSTQEALQNAEAALSLLEKEEASATPLEEIPEYAAVTAKIAEVDAAINSIGTDDVADGLMERKRTLNQMMQEHQKTVAAYNQNASIRTRIDELTALKEKIGAELSDIERQLSRLSEFVTARCERLEESINQRFDTVRWKLFDMQKNGEIRNTCDATVNGVPYGAGLNNAAEVNAGIEIIRVMSNAYDLHVPCFVDNAESVNTVSTTGGQMILLKVTDEPQLTYMLI